MAFLGKQYTLVKNENFDGFLKFSGVPEASVAAMLADKPSQKIVQNGDSYTLSSTSPKGPKDTIFKSGVEFDDVIGMEATPIKTTITVDGNTVTQTIKSAQGTATFKREFDGNDLVVTITSDKWDGVAKRYYKA